MEEPVSWPKAITLREVGPRDGIQSEQLHIDTGDKIGFIDALSVTGIRRIEAVSFVSPKALPQMADAPILMSTWPGPASGTGRSATSTTESPRNVTIRMARSSHPAAAKGQS